MALHRYHIMRILIFHLLLAPSMVLAQPYYHDHVTLAQQAVEAARYDSAAIHYERAFQRYVGLGEHRADYAKVLKHLGAEARSLEQLLFAIDSLHLHDYAEVLNDACFQKWERPELYIAFLRQADSTVTAHLSGLNTHYRDQLLEVHVVDQHIRKAIYQLELSEQVADTVMKKVWKALAPIDSLNSQRLIRLIAAYGYPDVDAVGTEANKAAWLVLQHADLHTQETYLPMLKESCDRGQTPMKYYAYVHDRKINNAGSSYVKYGCSLRLEEDGVFWLRAQNKSCINYYREQVGLPPLEEYRREGPCIEP